MKMFAPTLGAVMAVALLSGCAYDRNDRYGSGYGDRYYGDRYDRSNYDRNDRDCWVDRDGDRHCDRR